MRVAAVGVVSVLMAPMVVRRAPGRDVPDGMGARMLARVNVSTADFRTVMGQFATGVTVVTALDGDRPARDHGQRAHLGQPGPARSW